MNLVQYEVPFFFLIFILLLLVVIAVVIILKLAERLESERTLNAKQLDELKRFKLAVANVSDHIVITNQDGIVLYANKAVEKVTGYTIEETLGQKAGKLWGGQMSKDFYKKMWSVLAKQKKVFAGEVKNIRKTGQVYDAHVTITPVLDEDGQVSFYVGVERDITQEKEVDRAKTDFISITSHQLRTPLTVIKGYLALIADGAYGEVPSPVKGELLKVKAANDDVIGLVADLLNISRIESGKMSFDMKSIDLVSVVDRAVTNLDIIAKNKGLSLTFIKPSKALPRIQGDSDRLRELITNLVENSLKYTVDGGVIIKVENINNQLRFSVKDSGMGITMEDMGKLFSKFYRGTQANTAAVGGTGLSLYFCKLIVDAHGGKIWAESAGMDQGSTFCFTIPLA